MKAYIFVALFLFVVLTRLFPILPNFSPLMAFSLAAVSFLGRPVYAVLSVFAALAISDLFLGFHETMIFVYLPLIAISVMGVLLVRGFSWGRWLGLSLSGSLLFFIVSNFGVWAMSGLYEKSVGGLVQCFIAALPFYHLSLAADLVFGFCIFASLQKLGARSEEVLVRN